MKNTMFTRIPRNVLRFAITLVLFSIHLCTEAQIAYENLSCEGISGYDCLSKSINEANFVIEGTVLKSEKYLDDNQKWKIKTLYRVEKVFKGDYDKEQIEVITDISKMRVIYSKIAPEFVSGGFDLFPEKINGTSILRLEKVNDKFEIVLSPIPLWYALEKEDTDNYPVYLPERKGKIIYVGHRKDIIQFKTTKDLYNFILKHDKTYCKDITKNNFKKKVEIEKSQESFNKSQKPIIESFTINIGGGVDEILTITGTEFGVFSGKIQFFDENPFLNTDLIWELDAWDMSYGGGLIEWNNTTIKVRLPSNIWDIGGFSGTLWGDQTLLSSKMRVVKVVMMGDDEISDWTSIPVNIKYSVHQYIDAVEGTSTVNSKTNSNLATTSGENIFEFYVHQNVYDDCEAMAQINRALKEWKCHTGISFVIAGINNAPAGQSVPANGISTISFFTSQSGFTNRHGAACPASGFYEVTEVDIELNQSQPSIYNTMLHELGHAHGLSHTLPGDGQIEDLMNPAAIGGGGADVITADDLSGANEVKERSETGTTVCAENIDFTIYGDYAMRDNEDDVGDEPNCTAENGSDPIIDKSPDLWNCNEEFPLQCTSEHQDPLEGNDNWIHARVKNISSGCDAFLSRVYFYWAIGSTGQMWDEDWIQSTYGNCLIGDEIGSVGIGLLTPGQETEVFLHWIPPNINELAGCDVPRYPWDIAGGWYQICLLARIESDDDYNFFERLGVNAGDNVWNSNNIVTRNTKILDDPNQIANPTPPNEPPTYVGDVSWMFFHNNNDTQKVLDLVFGTEADCNIMGFQFIDILLSDTLFNQVTQEENFPYTVPEPNVVRLTGTCQAAFPNILMDAGERQLIGIRVAVRGDQISTYQSTNEGESFYVTHRSSQTINGTSASFFTFPPFDNGIIQSGLISNNETTIENANTVADRVLVYNNFGQVVSTHRIQNGFSLQQLREHLQNGIYILVYRNADKVLKSEKIVVVK